MARARNIKPSFFTNEELGELDPLARLLFIGMWTLADFKGDFEWKPKRIKIQILPYDECCITSLAINLDKSRLVSFYSDGDKMYCRVVNFRTHQNPHPNEEKKGSVIPGYTEDMRQLVDISTLTINRDKSRQVTELSVSDRAESLLLIPDSLNLNPESLTLNPEGYAIAPPVTAQDKPAPAPRRKREPVAQDETAMQSLCRSIWTAYGEAYIARYGTPPTRNTKVNSQIRQIAQRLGQEAIQIAAWFVSHPKAFYVQKMHTVDCLLSDAEALRTQWATNTRVTNTQARQQDQTATNANAAHEARELIRQQHEQQQGGAA